MLKKIKNLLFRIFYAIPFGMHGADSEIFGKSINEEYSINRKTLTRKLSDALRQGEVTQEVEELRYRTYKVAKEADNYNYLGEGLAIKNKNNKNKEVFYVKNQLICEGVGHELSRINEYSVDRYTLNINYSDIPRFKLEKYCNLMKVDFKSEVVTLFFEKHTNIPEHRMFFNELESMLNGKKSEIEDYPQSIRFFSDDTFYEYDIQKLSMKKITSDKFQYTLEYNFKNFTVIDFVKKYHSDELEAKYQKKEKKETVYNLNNEERKRYCNICGKEINTYDGDITEQTYGYALCQECTEKIKEIQNIQND